MKLSDATQEPAPIDPFKTCYVPKESKHKNNIPEKINHANHWQLTNQIGDPEFRKGHKGNLKWSEAEKGFKCEGLLDRQHRTFDKLMRIARLNDAEEA